MLSNARDCIQAPTSPTWWDRIWQLTCGGKFKTESNPWPQFSAFIHFTLTAKCTYYRAKITTGLCRHKVCSIQSPTTPPAGQSNQASRSFCWNPIITFHTFNSLLKRGWKPNAPILLSTNMDLELIPKTFRIVLPLFYATQHFVLN